MRRYQISKNGWVVEISAYEWLRLKLWCALVLLGLGGGVLLASLFPSM